MAKNLAQQLLTAAEKQAAEQNARLEAGRKREETERNDRRFDANNHRRENAKLEPFDWGDYSARKYGLPALTERLRKARGPQRPEHRDNIGLLNR